MTLIIGIVCRDGIVLAAESQTTKGNSKKLGTNKINVVEFEHDKVLVAEAGAANLSNQAIEHFQRKARGVKIDDDSIVEEIARESVLKVVRQLLEPYNKEAPPIQMQDFLWDDINSFELMVAYYFQGRPFIKMFRSAMSGVPDKTKSYFETSGIGSDLANYVLTKHTKPNMDSKFASVIAVKVLQDVSNHVEGCGLPMRIASLHHIESIKIPVDEAYEAFLTQPDSYSQTAVRSFSPKTINSLAKIISKVERESGKSADKKIESALRVATEKYNAKIIAKAEKMMERAKS